MIKIKVKRNRGGAIVLVEEPTVKRAVLRSTTVVLI